MVSRQDLPMDRRNKPALIPGDAANSLLVRLTRHEGPPNDPMPTPSKRERLSDADISMTERWVQAGAIMFSTLLESKRYLFLGEIVPREQWTLQPSTQNESATARQTTQQHPKSK